MTETFWQRRRETKIQQMLQREQQLIDEDDQAKIKPEMMSPALMDQLTSAGTDEDQISLFLGRFDFDDCKSLGDLQVNLASDDEDDPRLRRKTLVPYYHRHFLKNLSKRISRRQIERWGPLKARHQLRVERIVAEARKEKDNATNEQPIKSI